MPRSPTEPKFPNRREILQGGAVAAGALLVDGCHGAPGAGLGGHAGASAARRRALEVRGTRFTKDGKPFFVSGINYWAGTTLARDGERRRVGPGPARSRRDPGRRNQFDPNRGRDRRAGRRARADCPDDSTAPGQYAPAGVEGVLRFAEELQRRGLYGIYTLNNFWQWSGGFAQYIAWTGGGPIPYPPPAAGGSWDRFQKSNGTFYKNDKAMARSTTTSSSWSRS